MWGRVYYRRGQYGNRHATVRIAGLWCEPQSQARRRVTGIYRSKTFGRLGIRNKKAKRFVTFSAGKTVSSYAALRKAARANRPHVRTGRRGYCGVAGGVRLKGAYLIHGKLYRFNRKGYMSKARFRRYRKASAEGARWAGLKKLLGKPRKVVSADSCYGSGKDVIYTYAHIEVSVFKPNNGSVQRVEGVSAR